MARIQEESFIHVEKDNDELPDGTRGNELTIEVRGLAPERSYQDNTVSFSLTINDGVVPDYVEENYQEMLNDPSSNVNEEMAPNDDEYNTNVTFFLNSDDAIQLAMSILDQARKCAQMQRVMNYEAIEFKAAQLACAKGQVGKIEITRNGDTERPGAPVGFGYYTIRYFDDQPEQNLLHEVVDVECFVSPVQEEQFEWLRTLVGGNHQYTSTIKVDLTNFSLEDLSESFNAALQAHLNRQ